MSVSRPKWILWLLLTFVLIVGLDQGIAQRPTQDVLTKDRFLISFDDVLEVRATEVIGLTSETVVEEPRDSRPVSRRRLEPVRFIIVRKVQEPDALWEWRERIIQGRTDRRNGRVDLLRGDDSVALSFEIRDAWPYKWVWPNLDAGDPSPAYEEIHFLADEVRPYGR